MYVSNAAAVLSTFPARGPQQVAQSPLTSSPPEAGVPQASSSQGGSYDFTSLTPDNFIKNVNELLNAGKISTADFKVALRMTIKLPGSRNATLPKNYLESLQQLIGYDKQNSFAVPSQVQAEQSFLDKLTALQGTPKGVDKTA